MRIRILDKSYQVLYTAKGEIQGIKQHVCRDAEDVSGREYRIARIPSKLVTGDLIRFLLKQAHNNSFREFVDYVTDARYVTVLMDCGRGVPLVKRLSRERMTLRERLTIAEKLLEHLLLADFPPYFLCAAMDPERVKMTDAMEFGFDFDLSGLTEFDKADFPAACRQIADTLSRLFEPELKRRAFPDMERFFYGLRHGEWETLLLAYQEFLGICRVWRDKDEERLESRSFAFLAWETIKGLGRFLKAFGKAAAVLLAAGYLAYSIQQFVKPDPVQQVYIRIGELEVKTQPEAQQ